MKLVASQHVIHCLIYHRVFWRIWTYRWISRNWEI